MKRGSFPRNNCLDKELSVLVAINNGKTNRLGIFMDLLVEDVIKLGEPLRQER
jgi:hypothetical protein